jgi:hypothetical protein
MGAKFSIGYSENANFKEFNDISVCKDAISAMKKYIKNKINKIRSMTESSLSEDYNNYNLHPGQQIRRPLRKGSLLSHPAIYLIDGEILEVASGPKSCQKDLGRPMSISKNIFGISTLNDFIDYSPNNEFTAIEDPDYSKEAIITRLERAECLIGVIDYNYLLLNCVHIGNYISTGKQSLILPVGTNITKKRRSFGKRFSGSKKRRSKKRRSKKRRSKKRRSKKHIIQ